MPIVLKSGSLNLLERSGPVQACNGIALPLFPTILSTSLVAVKLDDDEWKYSFYVTVTFP
jgi:hypothetical protein